MSKSPLPELSVMTRFSGRPCWPSFSVYHSLPFGSEENMVVSSVPCAETRTTLTGSGNCRRLAREIEDVAVDRTNNDVEESGDGTCSCVWTQKVIALYDVAFVEQYC